MKDVNLILAWLYFPMLMAFVVSIVYPWRIRSRLSRILVHLPIWVMLVYLVYELLVPIEMDLRADLVILLPVMFVALVCYVVKLVKMSQKNDNAE